VLGLIAKKLIDWEGDLDLDTSLSELREEYKIFGATREEEKIGSFRRIRIRNNIQP